MAGWCMISGTRLFGHTGEEALCPSLLADAGGFDHNAQSLRIVTRAWSSAMPEFDGLNLTWETLEGLVKHNGPLLAEGAGRSRLVPENRS